MYKVASRLAQDGARRLKLRDLCTADGYEPSQQEERDNLKRRIAAIEAELLALPKGSQEANKRRTALGLEKFEAQERIRKILPRIKGPDVGSCFIKVVKEQVTKFQYDQWMKMAQEMKAEADAIAAETEPPSEVRE